MPTTMAPQAPVIFLFWHKPMLPKKKQKKKSIKAIAHSFSEPNASMPPLPTATTAPSTHSRVIQRKVLLPSAKTEIDRRLFAVLDKITAIFAETPEMKDIPHPEVDNSDTQFNIDSLELIYKLLHDTCSYPALASFEKYMDSRCDALG